jgi:hypothetical protein
MNNKKNEGQESKTDPVSVYSNGSGEGKKRK